MTSFDYLEGNNAPSRDLVTKYILKDEVVRARITKEFVGEQHEYLLGDGETFDGKRCDVLYVSTTAQSVLIEVQRSVDVEFMARIINYCSGLFLQKKFGLGLPYVVVFCIEEPAENVKSQLSTPSCSLPSFITQQKPSHYQLSRYPEYQLFYRLSVNFQELTNHGWTYFSRKLFLGKFSNVIISVNNAS
ncbi:hypothetical protein [Absidia glauca]|uniref:Uncharacterized protein n=1 Tax=Absidia glauca TaxID=4829 RepID=A0A163K526_ABSGL|nr:hypothetical protein [Absidia glauca]